MHYNNRHRIKVGRLVRIESLLWGKRDIKLYASLKDLKQNPFFGFDKIMKIEAGASLFSMIIRISCYEKCNDLLFPVAEAVQIIYDNRTWWIFAGDITEVMSNDKESAASLNPLTAPAP